MDPRDKPEDDNGEGYALPPISRACISSPTPSCRCRASQRAGPCRAWLCQVTNGTHAKRPQMRCPRWGTGAARRARAESLTGHAWTLVMDPGRGIRSPSASGAGMTACGESPHNPVSQSEETSDGSAPPSPHRRPRATGWKSPCGADAARRRAIGTRRGPSQARD